MSNFTNAFTGYTAQRNTDSVAALRLTCSTARLVNKGTPAPQGPAPRP